MDKKELRKIIRQRKQQTSRQELSLWSAQIIERLCQHKMLKDAQDILLYYSLPDEVNTHECIEKLYQEGKNIFLPKVIDNGIMEIRRYEGKDSMTPGSYNIMEPTGSMVTDYTNIELAIVPGMSFDSQGNRLGRGKGYYDRFLVQAPHLYKIGLCFDFQKVGFVPHEATDVPMDEVL